MLNNFCPMICNTLTKKFSLSLGCKDGAVVRALAYGPPMWLGMFSRTGRNMLVEFVAGSLFCPERFFSGYSDFPLSSKTNVSTFQFDPFRSLLVEE